MPKFIQASLLRLFTAVRQHLPWKQYFESLGVSFGRDVVIPAPQLVHLYGCRIGDGTKIGPFVEIQKKASIGSNCKISSHTFICEGVTIGNGVFVGHGVTFINDKHPRAITRDGTLQTEADWSVVPTTVQDGASIGSGATILCGVTVGRNAMIGAGAVVTCDVPAHAVWAGNPARLVRSTAPSTVST